MTHQFLSPSEAVKFHTFTPTECEFYLKNYHPKNRPLNKTNVERYADDMKDGTFHRSNDAITFSNEGNLINGQNRMNACIVSNEPFKAIVYYGVPPEYMEHLDDGARRTIAQNLILQGFAKNRNATVLANTWVNYDHNWKYTRSQKKVKQKLIDQARPIGLIIKELSCYSKLRRAGFLLACAQFILKDEQSGLEFYRAVISDGAGLKSDSPVLALRNMLLSTSGGGAGVTQMDYGRTVFAIHKWKKNIGIKRLHQTKFEWDF